MQSGYQLPQGSKYYASEISGWRFRVSPEGLTCQLTAKALLSNRRHRQVINESVSFILMGQHFELRMRLGLSHPYPFIVSTSGLNQSSKGKKHVPNQISAVYKIKHLDVIFVAICTARNYISLAFALQHQIAGVSQLNENLLMSMI